MHSATKTISVRSDHDRDDTGFNTPDSSLDSTHDQAFSAGAGQGVGSYTPDNYDYVDFDFNAAVSVVQRM